MHLGRRDDFMSTMLKCLEQREQRGTYGQIMYISTFTSHVSKAAIQLIGLVLNFI